MNSQEGRKLATIRKIDDIKPIEGADAIECAILGGWTVVIKKGEYSIGQLAIYIEIDSWVPTELAPFLSKGKEPREYNGIKGERLRTVKLRGQVSQGLLLPTAGQTSLTGEGDNLTEFLGIQKWEPPAEFRSADAKGLFPAFIPKTDQERVQNLKKEIEVIFTEQQKFEITEKLDGSSITVYYKDGEVGVCSRNLELKVSEDNTFWKAANDSGLVKALIALGRNLAVQGELIGPGIQQNRYKLNKHEIYCFDIFDIDKQQYLNVVDREFITLCLNIKNVPVINYRTLSSPDVMQLLLEAEGKSKLEPTTEREGLVYKNMETDFSFKAISNKWLLKNE
jgi:RNA ligase (TIGR02306 family)